MLANPPTPPRGRAVYADRLGTYRTAAFLDDASADRAAGRGGSGQRVRALVELREEAGRLVARYAVQQLGERTAAASTSLNEARIEGDRFSAAPIVIKAAWPYYVPASFEGRFVEPGVLLLEGRRYLRAPAR